MESFHYNFLRTTLKLSNHFWFIVCDIKVNYYYMLMTYKLNSSNNWNHTILIKKIHYLIIKIKLPLSCFLSPCSWYISIADLLYIIGYIKIDVLGYLSYDHSISWHGMLVLCVTSEGITPLFSPLIIAVPSTCRW